MKYRLIKEYPGCGIKLGETIEFNTYEVTKDIIKIIGKYQHTYTFEDCQYKEFWQKVEDEIELNKWYKLSNTNYNKNGLIEDYILYFKRRKDDITQTSPLKIFRYNGETIINVHLNRAKYNKFDVWDLNFNNGEKLEFLTNLDEIQEYLPDNHIDKIKKKDYEIISYRGKTLYNNNGLFILHTDGLYYWKSDDNKVDWLKIKRTTGLELEPKDTLIINSIKRLSDGEVFTVGDEINGVGIDTSLPAVIKEIKIQNGTVCIDYDGINGRFNGFCIFKIINHHKPLDYKIISYSQVSNRRMHSLTKRNDLWDIHKVKRLSDGIAFTLGDKVSYPGSRDYIIGGFVIDGNKLVASEHGKTVEDTEWSIINNIRHCKKPLFTTEDGVDIFEGDDLYHIKVTPYIWEIKGPYKADKGTKIEKIIINKDEYFTRSFTSKEDAEEYIIMNKPCLSLKDVQSIYMEVTGYDKYATFLNRIKNFIKSKL